MILRRLYLYLVSTAAAVMLAAGLALAGATVLQFVFNDPAADSSRGALAVFTAMTVVALPVWGIHFWFAQRFAVRDPYERTSAIRRFYFYFISLAASLATLIGLTSGLQQVLQPVTDTHGQFNGEQGAEIAWATFVFVVAWGFHFYLAARDRAAVGEEGTSSTLRRWYMYIALLAGFVSMLGGAQAAFAGAWTILASGSFDQPPLSTPIALALAGAVVWAVHARAISVSHISQDRHSTLRTLEGFIALTISIATALFGASQILYYGLALALGVDNPGGASNNLFVAAAGPVSQLLIYGVAWYLIRRRLARDTGTQEADRQAGVRRLYTNLAALVSLLAGAIGAGGLLWTLAEQIEAPIIGVNAPDWKQPLSVWTTLLVVGAVVWIAHWRHAPWADDRRALSRRLYVWIALLGSVLVVLGGGVGMINGLLQQLFSAHPRLNDPSNLDFGRYLGVILVAAAIGIYHLRVLRADAASRPPKKKTAIAQPAPASPAAAAPIAATEPAPAEVTGPHGRRYTLVVSDATEDDVHSALASLPPQASYKLTSLEAPVDGH